MDVLSEVLKSVTLKGAVFYNAEFSAPWSFRSPASHLVAQHLGAAPAHVIIYHLLIEGAAWAEAAGVQRVDLAPGDIVVFPHGDPHIMGNGPPVAPVDNGQELGRILSQGLAIARMGGGGAITRLVCGYMTCEPEAIRRILAGLPPLLTVNIRQDPSGAWLENSILFSVANAGSSSAGAEAVLARLSEALFIETLRRYAASLPASGTGWLAGARDPEVGKALGLLHSHPARAWTIEDLARSVGVSRAVLAGRFRHFLGEPPHRLPHALAPATRRAPAHHHQPQRGPDRRPGRLRVGSRLQPRLQADVRRAARPLPPRARRAVSCYIG